jgi:L-alanine-DL-glutamate epimerase-like enolase superfamily enzyme
MTVDGPKIDRVDATPLRLPLARPIASALGTYTHVDCTVVHVHTHDGPTGCGFTACLGGSASSAIVPYIETELAPLAIGESVLAPEALWHRMWGPNKARQRAGIGVWALSALDTAVWDALAKYARLPLHNLLGGYRCDVPVYGSGGWHTLDDEELVAECQAYAARGITAYKYKIGTDRDEARTARLRDAMGDDFVLLADANQKYTVTEAIEVGSMLADHGVAWLEEPVVADSVDDLADVAERSATPTAAGENAYLRWGFREIVEKRAAAFLQPDIGRCGGVTEFRKIGALADASGIALSSHLWHELSISLVGAFSSGWACEYAELIPAGTLTREFDVVDGCIRVPDVPGHGVEFTLDALERFR